MRVTFAMRLEALTNKRYHWTKVSKIKRGQRDLVAFHLRDKELPPLPVVVTLVRIAPIFLDDDNNQNAFKAVRDQIASAYGEDDRSVKYKWVYGQRKCKKSEPESIEITIEART